LCSGRCPADRVVHAFYHGSISGAALRVIRIGFMAVLFDQCLFGIERSVNTKHPVVQKERFVLMRFDKRNGFLRHAVFDVLVRSVRVEVRKFPGCNIAAGRSRSRPVRNVNVETMFQRRIRFVTQMPFAKMPCCKAGILECIRQRVVFSA